MNSALTKAGGCGCGASAAAPAAAGTNALSGPHALAAGGFGDAVKGELLTQALAFSGYATDPDALRVYYRQHKSEIDAYLRYVDVDDLAGTIAGGYFGEGQAPAGTNWASLAIGVAGGAALTLLYFELFAQNDGESQ